MRKRTSENTERGGKFTLQYTRRRSKRELRVKAEVRCGSVKETRRADRKNAGQAWKVACRAWQFLKKLIPLAHWAIPLLVVRVAGYGLATSAFTLAVKMLLA